MCRSASARRRQPDSLDSRAFRLSSFPNIFFRHRNVSGYWLRKYLSGVRNVRCSPQKGVLTPGGKSSSRQLLRKKDFLWHTSSSSQVQSLSLCSAASVLFLTAGFSLYGSLRFPPSLLSPSYLISYSVCCCCFFKTPSLTCCLIRAFFFPAVI